VFCKLSVLQLLFCRTDKILPGNLKKGKEGKVFRGFLKEHILILPGSPKRGERVKITKIFLADYIKFCLEA